MQSTKKNHCYHSRQKQDNNQRIQDGKPLNIRVRHRLQNVVPTRWPFCAIILLITHTKRKKYKQFKTIWVETKSKEALLILIMKKLFVKLYPEFVRIGVCDRNLVPLFQCSPRNGHWYFIINAVWIRRIVFETFGIHFHSLTIKNRFSLFAYYKQYAWQFSVHGNLRYKRKRFLHIIRPELAPNICPHSAALPLWYVMVRSTWLNK